MDQVEHVKKLREEYERALDAAESRRSAYHEAVLELYQGGVPLREIAKELGLSHQRVHQIVSGEPAPGRSRIPRAAGGAAGAVLLLAAGTFGALRLTHAPPFAQRTTTAPSHVSVAYRLGGPIPPGGAVRRKKREIVARPTPIGQVSLWIAPDRVSRSAHCSWLQVGDAVLGGSCYQPPRRGLPQVVPVVFRSGSRPPYGPHGPSGPPGPSGPSGPSGPPSCPSVPSSRSGPSGPFCLPGRPPAGGWILIWGRTGPGVDDLTLVFRDGERMRVPDHDGMFLITGRVLEARWRNGYRPSLLVARDTHGRIVDERPIRLDLAASY